MPYKNRQNELIKQIGNVTKKVVIAMELMLSRDVQPDEYRKVKDDASSTIARLEMRLTEVNLLRSNHVNIKKVTKEAVNALLKIDTLYDMASIPGKRGLVGMIFSEKFTFVSFGTSFEPFLR